MALPFILLPPRKCQEEVDHNFEGLFKELKGGKAVHEFQGSDLCQKCLSSMHSGHLGWGLRQVMAQCQKAETCVRSGKAHTAPLRLQIWV